VTREVFTGEDELAAALAGRLLAAIRQRPQLVLGLPTGRTPLALYQCLRTESQATGVDWSQVRTFNLDEFVGLGAGDSGSYRAFMEERLFRHLDVDPTLVGFLDGRAPDLERECARYDHEIAAAGNIDVLILGIGANGHVGFNEPADALTAATHRAALDEPTRAANALWFDGDLRRVPREALTMGMRAILSARTIVLIATGEGKAGAVRAMVEGGVTPRVPASFLQLHPRTAILLDAEAAGELTTAR
jgi:glucosamine-6-phosphate deaminase